MHLKPASYCIVRFGGVRSLARGLNEDQAYISRWRKRDGEHIPGKFLPMILALAKEMVVDIRPEHLIYGGEVNRAHIEKNFKWMLK